MNRAPLIGISRLRMGTDGHGVTTLVAFHGCPLRCKYCLNPQSLSDDAKVMMKTPEEVMEDETLNINNMERRNIMKALQRNHYRRKAAADELGISERTLYRKIKAYGIEE